MKSIQQLQQVIHYQFHNITFLEVALTHSSYANEMRHQVRYNERQEFLGDAVLSIIVSDYLFNNYTVPEGDLTKLRAALVCERSLDVMANKIGLGDYLRLGHGEEMTGGRTRPSIIADAFEALIAAIYLDGGMEPAKRHILRFLVPALENHTTAFKDYKTTLQEVVQQNPGENVTYVLVGESGPDHDKRFQVQVRLNSNVIGSGVGRSKKEAEQEAAKEALHLMGL